MEGYQQGGGIKGKKVQGMRSINGRYKIDGGGWGVVKNSVGNLSLIHI